MRDHSSFLSVAAAALLSLSCVAPATSNDRNVPAMATTVCDLMSRPASFDGKVVTVSAIIKPTAHYGMAMSDARCVDQTVALIVPSKLDGDADVEKLRSAVFAGYPRANRGASARVTGDYHTRPGEVPSRVFSLRSVADIETESR